MLPVILVAVGAYLIGDSVLGDKKYVKGGEVDEELIDSSAKSIYDKKGMMSLRNTFLQVAKADEDAGDKETADYRRKVVAEYQSKQPKLMAHGGKTQGYDDKEDERLAMEHGKMSKKDLDSTHARRDDAEFEERGKMAKGGKAKDYDGEKYRVADVYYSDIRKDLFIVTESKPTYIVVKYKDGFVDKITKEELKELKDSGDLDYIDKNVNLSNKYIFKDAFYKGK
jgi:hypothetical protein